jgi:broad specificity phosphatase PhoE
MKVFAAFQSVAFLRSSSTSSTLLSQRPQESALSLTRTQTTATSALPTAFATATATATATTATTRRGHRHFLFLSPAVLFLSNNQDNPVEMTNDASNNNNNNNNNNCTATATLDPRPPPSKRVLLSDILPPLPEGSRRLYLLRHGETDWNALGKIQGGGYDIPLNDNGRSQAWTTAHVLDDIPIGVIASSQLSRAKETADILFQRHADDTAATRVIHAGFAEMSFGEFEGLASRDEDLNPQLKRHFLKISKQIKADKTMAFPGGGESTIQVEERSRAALFQLLEDHPEARHVAVVSHGRTNKVLLASVAMGDVSKFPQVKQSSEYFLSPLCCCFSLLCPVMLSILALLLCNSLLFRDTHLPRLPYGTRAVLVMNNVYVVVVVVVVVDNGQTLASTSPTSMPRGIGRSKP